MKLVAGAIRTWFQIKPIIAVKDVPPFDDPLRPAGAHGSA